MSRRKLNPIRNSLAPLENFSNGVKALALLFFCVSLFPGCGKTKTPKKERVVCGGTISTGDTLIEIFEKHNIPPNNYIPVITKFKIIFNTRKMKPGDYYEVAFSTAKKILEFSYSNTPEVKYSVRLTTAGYKAAKIKLKLYKKVFGFSGKIKGNLYNSMMKAGVTPFLIMNFADIFESRIDFLTEPRAGDRFFIIFEKFFTEKGQEVDRGNILAGKYIMTRKKKNFIAFAYPFGPGYDYFDPRGRSLGTQFLKAPLHYRRISSYFANRRFHPILRYYRPHHGIDYAAQRGTPVSAIGDGKVIFAGRKGGLGKLIKIRHNSVYESWYGHLSRYGKKIRKGRYVKKGQVIGYVGSTGLSTGPHLCFRIKKRGRLVNFLKLKLPPAKRLTGKQMKKFPEFKKIYYRYFAELQQNGSFESDGSID